MPLREFDCKDCSHVTESLIRNDEDLMETTCAGCGGRQLTMRTLYATGAYFIKGNNSASERPKHSRSTERKRK